MIVMIGLVVMITPRPMQRKIFARIICATVMIGAIFGASSFVFAQSDYNKQLGAFAGEGGANFGERKDPRSMLATVIASFLTVLGTVFLAYSVYGGAIIMTSAGNAEKIEEGKATLRRGVIGVIIILCSYSIVVLVERMAPRVRPENQPLWEKCTDNGAFCSSFDITVEAMPANEQDTTPVCWWIFCRER